ncbi:hypothetical protein EMIT0196MI5_90030 [Pseudomonas sp. IT-196MI5]
MKKTALAVFLWARTALVGDSLTLMQGMEHYKVLFFVPLGPSWNSYLQAVQLASPSSSAARAR